MTVAPSSTAKSGVLPVPKPERQPKGRREREALYTYACLPAEVPECWFAQFAPGVPCEGQLQKAHLIRAQVIRREIPASKLHPRAILWAPQVWRPACYRHHSMLDQAKTLRIPREAIPVETEQWAAENGLGYWLDKTYGERVA